MICCSDCFNDSVIKGLIISYNHKGSCEVCEKGNVYIWDTENKSDINNYFEGFFDLYTPVADINIKIPIEEQKLLKDILKQDWQIFSIDEEQIQELIISICRDRYEEMPQLFDTPVVIKEAYDERYLSKHSILFKGSWEDFVEDIKHTNRFHSDSINLNMFSMFLERITKTYEVGTTFYRGRFSDEKGWEKKKMGAPPKEFATAGRANTQGISCLYLANDRETTFYEIRARVHDYISVGTFRAKQDIRVINLKGLENISPFDLPEQVAAYAINKLNLSKIAKEIAKPLRRHDSELEYLPTQYISEFIKYKGYDGIEYESTISSNGYNLAIFNEELFDCVGVEVFEIQGLEYCSDRIIAKVEV